MTTTDSSNKVDILVIGGGPVGLMCALESKRMGAGDVRIVDKAQKPMELCKASTVWPRTIELLKYAHPSVYQDMKEYSNKVATFALYHGMPEASKIELMAKMELHGKFNSEVETAFNLEQFMTEKFLRKDLEKRFGISTERGVSVTNFQDMGDYVRVELQKANGVKEIVHTRYLVGCDGAHSFTRRNLNLNYPGEAFDADFLISHCKIKGISFPRDEIFTVLDDDGMAFAIPMPNDTWELIMDLSPEKSKAFFGSEKPRDPTLEELNGLFRKRVPGLESDAPIHSPQWLGHFRVNSRQVEKYSVGRVYMCGDACHIHSPAGGQGMNFGMQDACNLGWKLGMVLRGTSSPQLLNSYHLERWPVGKALVGVTEKQTKAVFSTNKNVRRLQYLLIPIVGHHASKLSSKAAPIVGETIYSYHKSPLSAEYWCFESLSNAFSNLFFRLNPIRILQRRRTGITRFITKRTCAGDRLPHAVLSSTFGEINLHDSQKTSMRRTSALHLLFGGHVGKELDPTIVNKNVTDRKNLRTTHSLCNGSGLTALLFEASPGYADDSFGHGGQEVDLQSVAWKLETMTDGLIKAHILGPEELEAQRAFKVFGQCMFLVRPDGYIAFRSQPVDVNATMRYLQGTMGIRTLVQISAAEGENSSRESDLATVTRMLGLVILLVAVNIGLTAVQMRG